MAINLDKDEYIMFEVRKHWFTLVGSGLFLLLLIFIPIFIYSLVPVLPFQLESDHNLLIMFLFLYVNWLIVIWVAGFMIWTDHYLDVWIITNKNLINVEQIGVFHREISTTRLGRIQDVSSEVSGLAQTFLNYGSLSIQNAGSNSEFKISGIENPIQVSENLEKAITQYKDTMSNSTL